MVNPGSIIGAMTEEFQEIGKQVVTETVKAPKDIVGTALESVGVGGGKKQKAQTKPVQSAPQPGSQAEADHAHAQELKKAIARQALAELAGGKKKSEPGVWERIQKEEEQKKEQKKQQKAHAAKTNLPQTSSKRKRGDLFGMKAKKTAAENKNVRQD